MAEAMEDKKNPASPLRRRRARQEGLFPRSQEWSVALVWLFGVATLDFGGGYALDLISSLLAKSLTQVQAGPPGALDWYARVWGWVFPAALILFPWIVGIFCVALAVHFAQAGFEFRPQRLSWNWGGLASRTAVWEGAEVGKAFFGWVLKWILVIGVIGASVGSQIGQIVSWSELPLEQALGSAWEFLLGMGWWLGFGWLVLAGLDYGWQCWRHEVRIRMTDNELREEFKESQGDSRLRSRRRKLFAER